MGGASQTPTLYFEVMNFEYLAHCVHSINQFTKFVKFPVNYDDPPALSYAVPRPHMFGCHGKHTE